MIIYDWVLIFYQNVWNFFWCGLRRQKVFVFYAKSDIFKLFSIQMLEFSFGVACGAKKVLYFTLKMIFSCTFAFGMPAGAKSWSILDKNGRKSLKIPSLLMDIGGGVTPLQQ